MIAACGASAARAQKVELDPNRRSGCRVEHSSGSYFGRLGARPFGLQRAQGADGRQLD